MRRDGVNLISVRVFMYLGQLGIRDMIQKRKLIAEFKMAGIVRKKSLIDHMTRGCPSRLK